MDIYILGALVQLSDYGLMDWLCMSVFWAVYTELFRYVCHRSTRVGEANEIVKFVFIISCGP